MAAAPAGPTEDQLLPIVRRIVGRDTATIRTWKSAPLTGGLFSPPLHVSGIAAVGPREIPFTCVVKRAKPSDIEVGLYHSGTLAYLPGPLRAPACHGVQDTPDAAWIWLEYVPNAMPGPWPPERMAAAARHLGATQGRLLPGARAIDPALGPLQPRADGPGPAPALPPLEQNLDALIAGPLRDAADSEALWSLDPFAALAGRGGRDRLRALQRRWPGLRAALAEVPRVLCHGDFHRHNLASAADDAATIALDWQMAAWGWLGHDVVGLAFGVIPEAVALDDPAFPSLEQALLSAYRAGLADAGWHGDPRLVELGYLTSTIHRARLQHVLAPAADPGKRTSDVMTRLGGFEAMARFICMRTETALSRLDRAYRLADERTG